MADASTVAGVAKSIGSALVTEAKSLYGVEDQIRALQSDLECMQEFLKTVDANPKLLTQDGQIRILAHKMRELAFRAEDAIDTYLVDVRSKIYNKNFLLKFLCLASHSYPMHVLRKEIEAIQQETKEDMSRAEKFRMSISTTCQSQEAKAGSSSSNPASENYLHLDDEFVVGIEDDVTKLVKRLTDPEDDFKVLGIVGTGGGGKTTLASKIYHHNKVKSSFPCRAFVSISQQWNRLDLLRRISKEVIGDFQIPTSETELVRQLHDYLMGKQCLVVLDDIWKKEAWDNIYPILPHTRGFRAILTTRIEEVPLYADKKCVLHQPKLLTEEQMWSLFSKGAVEGRCDIENNVEFEKLGRVMLQKCHGLPLAVVTLAGILRTKKHLYEWERISIACLDNILVEKGGSKYGVVEEMLQLSYLDLPTHLKPLFLYLSIIPEDMIFESEKLIQMWIAEGFITDDQLRNGSLEDKAMCFFGEMAQRYIFQVISRDHQNQIQSIRLHDLMREFCIKKAMECQFFENINPSCLYKGRSSKARRLSVFSREYCLEENHHTRTIVYNSLPGWDPNLRGTIKNLESIHMQFKLLRVLSIKGCKNEWLPKEIGNLIHLTYFSLVNTRIYDLPQSIKNLRNLIYLEFFHDIRPGASLIPNDLVGNMENLRVLILPERLKRGSSKCNNRLGLSSQRHKKMHTLSCGAGAWLTNEQMDFPTTIRELRLYNIEETEEMEAVYGWLNFLKGNLHSFECRFAWATKNSIVFAMEKLREHTSLQTLNLSGPLLLSDNSIIQFPPNLVSIILYDSKIREEFDPMEVLGLLSELKYLRIQGCFYMGTKLKCAGTAFPKLQELALWNLGNIQEWRLEGRAMNCLKKIHISYCCNLKRLPHRIRFITTLQQLEIHGMPKKFCERLGYTEGGKSVKLNVKDAYIIEHIPTVLFGRVSQW